MHRSPPSTSSSSVSRIRSRFSSTVFFSITERSSSDVASKKLPVEAVPAKTFFCFNDVHHAPSTHTVSMKPIPSKGLAL